MGKIALFTLLLISNDFYTQNRDSIIIGDKKIRKYDIIVEFDKKDSITIKKRKNNIYVCIYYEENIEYNKSKQKIQLPDDKILCEECKNEFDLILVSKPKKRIKNIKIIPAKEWKQKYYLGELDAEHFMEYIKIDKYYYKVFGDVMID